MEEGSVEKAIHIYFDEQKSAMLSTRRVKATEIHDLRQQVGLLASRIETVEGELARLDGLILNIDNLKNGVAKSVADACSG